MPYPGNSKRLLKKNGYFQFTDGNEIYPALHPALISGLGTQPLSLNAAWFSLPTAPCPLVTSAIQSAEMLLNLRPPFIPDHLPSHGTPVVVTKSCLVLVTANKDLAVLSQDSRRGSC